MKSAGVTEIITETGSGKVTSPKPRRDALLAELESGDTLVIWKLDRLGRSMSETILILENLNSRGITLRIITEGFDTSGTLGKMLAGIIAGLAEMEREAISERTKAGLAAARADGKTLGRPQVITDEDLPVLQDLLASGRTNAQIARALRCSQSSVVRAKRRLALDGEMAA
ncbi:phage DNA invertase [Corynebacterium terpenotabidum Y-11]|uniref:Phage DNA invertase n=2 Tax=Corynebacterium terpenotabidum TaxID=89154 RepID=S4XER7_9CORY|nr:phage DNA invertase [Corynebacterium terpenotabidum Y-11]